MVRADHPFNRLLAVMCKNHQMDRLAVILVTKPAGKKPDEKKQGHAQGNTPENPQFHLHRPSLSFII
jgi:hypothetical protein